MARAIDQLVKAKRITMEPKVPPEGITTLPAEQGKEVSKTGDSPVSKTDSPVTQQPKEVPPTTTEPVEEPTATRVVAFIKPILNKGTTMVELRQTLGHKKGKAWTAILDENVDHIMRVRNEHHRSSDVYRIMREEGRSMWGSMVAAMLKLPRSNDGTIIGTWEKEILCSNPKGPSKVTTNGTDSGTEKRLPDSGTGTNQQVNSIVPDNEMILPQVDGTDMDDVLRYIEPSC